MWLRSIDISRQHASVLEKLAVSSKLTGGIGTKFSCNLKTSRKKMVEKSIKFLFGVKNRESNLTWYLKKWFNVRIKGK